MDVSVDIERYAIRATNLDPAVELPEAPALRDARQIWNSCSTASLPAPPPRRPGRRSSTATI